MSDIVQLYDASNNAVYPVTHLKSVRDSSGTTLESMMQDVREITVGYYECSTSGNIAAKTITIDSSVYLSTKILCKVKFVEKNTAANATLNINQTGAKPLYYNGVRVSTNNSWYAGEIVTLFYDGSAFQLNSLPELNEYDVSAKNPTGGPNSDGKFTLAYILSNANTLIPTSVRKGGMSIKFVLSSDNKYVQARCMAQSFTTDVTQWQGVDDEPTAGSENLVKSGGISKWTSLNRIPKALTSIVFDDFVWNNGYYRASDGNFVLSTSRYMTDFIEVVEGSLLTCHLYNTDTVLSIACFDKDLNIILNSSVANDFFNTFTVPAGIRFIRFCTMTVGSAQTPPSVKFPLNITELVGVNNKISALSVLNANINNSILLLRAKTDFEVTKIVITQIQNTSNTLNIKASIYEATHPSTPWNVTISESQNTLFEGVKRFTYSNNGLYSLSFDVYFYGTIVDLTNQTIEIPIDNIIQEYINPVGDIFDVKNDIGGIISNEVKVNLTWKNGRLDYNNEYKGWTSSDSYINSGYFVLPAGKYRFAGRCANTNRAPKLIAYNSDYTFNRIVIFGDSSFSTDVFTLSEDTIVAANSLITYVSGYELVKINEGSLDICKNFSEVDNKLYYKDAPIASETSVSTLVADLPVSDGTGIQSGYAYIDNMDRTIKVKP